MRIIGIDPGLQITGYGVVDWKPQRPALVDAGIVRLNAKTSIPDRLVELEAELESLFDEHKPDTCAVEQLYSNYAHPRTAILMAHARGAFFLAGAQRGIPVLSYASTKVKKLITGSGRAGKEQMQLAMLREFRLPQMPEPHDVADALAIALCHYFASRGPVRGSSAATFTGVNRAALFASDPDEFEDAAPA